MGFTSPDVDPDFDDLDPIKALKELKQYGRVAEEMEELGGMLEQIRREVGSLRGLVNHYVFTGAPGTGKTSVCIVFVRRDCNQRYGGDFGTEFDWRIRGTHAKRWKRLEESFCLLMRCTSWA